MARTGSALLVDNCHSLDDIANIRAEYEEDVDADSSSESFEDVTSFGVRLERAEEQVR